MSFSRSLIEGRPGRSRVTVSRSSAGAGVLPVFGQSGTRGVERPRTRALGRPRSWSLPAPAPARNRRVRARSGWPRTKRPEWKSRSRSSRGRDARSRARSAKRRLRPGFGTRTACAPTGSRRTTSISTSRTSTCRESRSAGAPLRTARRRRRRRIGRPGARRARVRARAGIVHRDVKPSNVLVAEEDDVSVRLFDFGLAQLADADTLTAVGDVPARWRTSRPSACTASRPARRQTSGRWECCSGRRSRAITPSGASRRSRPERRSRRERRRFARRGPIFLTGLVAAVDARLRSSRAPRRPAAGLARELRDAWWERSPGGFARAEAAVLEPRRVVRETAAPGLALGSLRPGPLPRFLLPRPLAAPARGARRGADRCASPARARLRAGRPRVSARQRLVRARGRVRPGRGGWLAP